MHEQLNFKFTSATGGYGVAQSTSRDQAQLKHVDKINNALKDTNRAGDQCVEKPCGAVSNVSALTFDNMKETNLSQVQFREIATSSSSSSCKNILVPFTMNQISEDSNHSSISEQSSESDQCCVMKNLKLRSSPVVSQSVNVIPNKIANVCDSKSCDVTSSDDIFESEIGEMDTEVSESCESGFKRVSSLQDIRNRVKAMPVGMAKAASDIDLTGKSNSEVIDRDDVAAGSSASDNNFVFVTSDDSNEVGSSDEVVLNNRIAKSSIPLLEDLYFKETKTLNTNVLASDLSDDKINVDSEKFAKYDNTVDRAEIVIDEEDVIQNAMDLAIKNDVYGPGPKKIKDVNIRANKKSKSPGGGACRGGGLAGEGGGKRMKFEGLEKNVQLQEMCRLQKESLLRAAMTTQTPADKQVMMRV